MSSTMKNKTAPTFGDPPSKTEMGGADSVKTDDNKGNTPKKDKSVSKAYSMPKSFHELLTRTALERSLAEGKNISASKVLYEAAKKGLNL